MKNNILNSDFYIKHGNILLNSFKNLLGYHLVDVKNNTAIKTLWDSPFALVSHGTENDPVFNFGNKLALDLFELKFEKLIKMHSRCSAEKIEQSEREELLKQVTRDGYIKNYSGIRISSGGKRFLIENAVVWNLYDQKGEYYGQAAMFKNWKYL